MAKKPTRDEVAATLTAEQESEFRALIEDYKKAAGKHVSGWRGGASFLITAELVREGWRKVPADAGSQLASQVSTGLMRRIWVAITRAFSSRVGPS